ncbi:triphosphoribosyl-dephospho-CoA synthase [Halobium salinum]|uniref:Triphosphoribosyl-dephospho-CoA synthase n=1 Tax=Halobium salinum TaxID=1364940 RepID=A0ABD5P8V1_9EURY
MLEVAGTPKPGNVDRRRDLDDLRFEQFLAGGVGSGRGLRRAAGGAPVGEAFERAVDGMSQQSGGNTQFGCLLLLVPLVRAAAAGDLSPAGVTDVVEGTTVEDAADFYRAFDHVAVAVGDPPADAPDLDVRHGSDAVSAVRERGVTLYDVMELAVERGDGSSGDGNAREWVSGFPRTFRAAESIGADEGPVLDRAARAFVDLLADDAELDTLVATQHGPERAREVRRRAREVGGDPQSTEPPVERIDLDAAEALAEEFAADGVNPGTTADAVAAALFVALERGVTV